MAATDSTAHVHSLLAARYAGEEWAYLTETPDGSGMKKQRTADAIAIGLWAKNAREFHAFEVKSSRSDWRKELEYPDKSSSWRELCTSFWLVAGRNVAKIEEVPPDWGFLEVSRDGGSLKLRKQPAVIARPTVPLNVVGALLRKAIDQIPPAAAAKVKDANEQYQNGYKDGRLREQNETKHIRNRIEHLDAVMRTLNQMFGKSVEFIKEDDFAVQLVMAANSNRLGELLRSIRFAGNRLADVRRIVDGMDDRLTSALSEIEAITTGLDGKFAEAENQNSPAESISR